MVEAADPQYRIYDGIWYNDLVLTGSNGNTFRQQAWDFRGANGLPSPGFTVRVVTRNSTNATMAFIGDSIGVGVAGTDTAPLRIVTDGTFASSSFDSAVNRRTNVADRHRVERRAGRSVAPGEPRPRRGRTRVQRPAVGVRRPTSTR